MASNTIRMIYVYYTVYYKPVSLCHLPILNHKSHQSTHPATVGSTYGNQRVVSSAYGLPHCVHHKTTKKGYAETQPLGDTSAACMKFH